MTIAPSKSRRMGGGNIVLRGGPLRRTGRIVVTGVLPKIVVGTYGKTGCVLCSQKTTSPPLGRGRKEVLRKERKNVYFKGLGKIVESSGFALEAPIRRGLRRILGEALHLGSGRVSGQYRNVLRPDGRRLVTRNGSLPEGDLLAGIGPIQVKQPRVRDDRERQNFTSNILPPFPRRLPSIDELTPALYLKGISTGDFSETLQAILGPRAKVPSATNIVRLTQGWKKDREAREQRYQSGRNYVYWWAERVCFNVLLKKDRPCFPVLMGATGDERKELVAVWDWERDGNLSWLTVLRDLTRRGLPEGPTTSVGDEALGFWAALEEEHPDCEEQRCRVHETANISDGMPNRIQTDARKLIHGMYQACKKENSMKSCDEFVGLYGARYPRAVNCLTKDKDVLFTFQGFPAGHWIHLRITNPIELTFATPRHRSRRTKGCGILSATLAMVFPLARAAEKKWRCLNGRPPLAEVISGVEFVDGEKKKEAA